MNDIFICYRGESVQSCGLGSRIYNQVQAMTKYHVFFAPESIRKGENFKSVVPKVMETVTIVILLLDKGFFDACKDDDDIVNFELICALKNENIVFLPIFLNHFTFKDIDLSDLFSKEEIDRIKHVNGIDYNGIYNFSIEHDIIPIIDDLYNGGNTIKSMSQRSSTRYHGANEQKELDFLELQQDMLFEYDKEVIEKLLKNKENLQVLDIGCNNGSQIMRRFGNDSRIKTIVGIDKDSECIKYAKENYSQAIFECMDIECDDFRSSLKQICNNVEKFDLITISMLLLHLERPAKLLTTIKSALKPNGIIFIRDIDDGLNIFYPDNNKIFSTLTGICKYCDILGYRFSGREIYSYLVDAGFTNIKLEKSGFDTSCVNFEQKEALFDIYFGYIPIALQKTIDRNPSLLRAKHDLAWVKQNINTAYDEFMKKSFLFSLGYMIYTAEN